MPPTLQQGRMPEAAPHARRSVYVPAKDELTEMQQRFCQEYMIDLDGRMAAVRAGYTPDRAERAAVAILRHPPARDYLARIMAVRSARTGLNADRVVRQLGAILNADPGDLFTDDGGLKNIKDMAPADRLLIAGVKTSRRIGFDDDGQKFAEQVTEVKLVSREALMSLAMRHFGMLNDKVTVEHTSLADRLREAQARREGKLVEPPTIDGELFTEPDEATVLLTYETEANRRGMDEETWNKLQEVLG